jgi:RpiB/LacA/LacB family sugar-phosphate isomerase
MRKVHIANDHAAVELKPVLINWLTEAGYEIVDHGSNGTDSVDYPDHAHRLATAVEAGEENDELGILICGSANGISMSANKHAGIRAAICWRPDIAALARQHNNANVIALPARFIAVPDAIDAVRVFLETSFEGGRHARRVGKIACGTLAMLVAWGVCTSNVQAQSEPVVESVVSSDTTAATFAELIDVKDLRQNLYILASDAMNGRETGKPGARLAAEFVASKFEKAGLETVQGSYFQPVPLLSSQINGGHMHFGESHGHFMENFMPSQSVSVALLEDKAPVFVGYGVQEGDWDDYAGLDVSGHIVVMLKGAPDGVDEGWTSDFDRKREVAERLGATAVVATMESFDDLLPRYERWITRDRMRLDLEREGTGPTIPTFWISDVLFSSEMGSMKKVLKRLRKGKGRGPMDSALKIEMDVSKRSFDSENVWGALPGSDPLLADEWLVISCHYDHIGAKDGEIFNGADDDGSGTVSLIECAEAWTHAAEQGFGPRRSVLFLAFVGEEKGLLGSDWYTSHPAVPLARTVCDLNIDMVGRTDAEHPDSDRYVYLIGSDKLSSDLHSISEGANSEFTGLALDYTFNAPDDPNRYYYRSDHYNFAKHNVPVIFYFSGVHEDYHGAGDTPDKIHYEKLSEIARLVFHTSWKVANRDMRLRIDQVNDFPSDR